MYKRSWDATQRSTTPLLIHLALLNNATRNAKDTKKRISPDLLYQFVLAKQVIYTVYSAAFSGPRNDNSTVDSHPTHFGRTPACHRHACV